MTKPLNMPTAEQAAEVAAGLRQVMRCLIDGETRLSDVIELPGAASVPDTEVIRDALHAIRLVTRTLSIQKAEWLKYEALIKEENR